MSLLKKNQLKTQRSQLGPSKWLILLVLCQVCFTMTAAEMGCPVWGIIDGFKREGLERGKYLGRWFQQRSHANILGLSGKCWSKYYSRKFSGNPFLLMSTTDSVSSITGFSHSNEVDVTIEDITDATLFTPNVPILLKERYRVLATDYTNFAVEYSCSDTSLMSRKENIWILTRKKRPSKRVMRKAKRAMRALGINFNKLARTDQSCDNELTDPPLPKDVAFFEDSLVRRNFEAEAEEKEGDYDYYTDEEDVSQYSSGEAEWKTPVDLAKDFMGSLAFVGQAIFAPWTLPGQPFSVDPENLPQHQNT